MRVLIVEDDPHFAVVVKTYLETEKFETELVHTSAEAMDRILSTPFDALLLDLMLGGVSGLGLVRELHKSGSQLPIIVMTAHGSIESVSEAMQLNAFDYITKPFQKSQIVDVLKRAVASRSKKYLDGRKESTTRTVPMVGRSPSMVEVYKAMARVSKTDSTVLITGESGTGKELAARAIHENSVRSRRAFIPVNCGALSETLLESELFGHTKGSFTGANKEHRGIFESASGGTVFLDEISETSPAFQVKLLRVLQQRMIKPVGSSEERPIDVRVIAATNVPADKLLSSGFRKDLLYRLSVINIHIPPLRERIDDIPLLAHYFLRRFNRRQKKSIVIPESTMKWAQTLSWEGNVRELENAIERAVTMNLSGELLPGDFTHFGFGSKTFDQQTPEPALAALSVDEEAAEAPLSLQDVTRQHIVRVLTMTGGNKMRAAKMLGIGRYSLYRMTERMEIKPEELVSSNPPAAARKREPRQTANPQDLFDNVNDIIYTRDFEGAITSINAAGERFFGHPRQTLIGRSLHEFFENTDLEQNLRDTNEKLLKEGVDRSVVSVPQAGGRIRHLECNVSLVRSKSGKPIGARGIMRDVTEAKEFEEQLHRRTRELEEANEKLKELDRIKADFTAMLVHDLKTPAASMMMALEFIRDQSGKKGSPEVLAMISAGLSSGRTILEIVQDMLEIFRFESNQIELSPSLLRVEEVVENAFNEIAIQATRKKIHLSKTVSGTLPDIHADKLMISRVISNLLSNAIKFTPSGGKVHLGAEAKEGSSLDRGNTFVEIRVTDTGEGIAPELVSYIFDPYWQASRKGVGTGLGLAVVKRIVSAHGGNVSVVSKLGVGSEFLIKLPAAS